MKQLLGSVNRLPDPVRTRVRARAEVAVSTIEQAGRLSWLPFSANYELTAALDAELGREGMEQFFHDAFFDVWESPLLKALTEFVLRLVGRDPAVATRYFSRGFPQLFRDCGQWESGDVGEGVADVFFQGFPPVCLDDGAMWLYSVRGSLSSMFDLAKIDGEVLVAVEAETRTARYQLRWDPDELTHSPVAKRYAGEDDTESKAEAPPS